MKKTDKRGKLVVGNWKMNPQSPQEAVKIFAGIKRVSGKVRGVDVVVCPPFPFLSLFSKKVDGAVSLGAQDVFWVDAGSFTGEVSVQMLKNTRCSHVIVGHSERRAFGETNEIVSKKIESVLKLGLTAILCIGEKERDKNGDYLAFLKNQIKESLEKVNKKTLPQIVIAYEPIWAIGKSFAEAMQGNDMQEMSIFIKKTLVELFGKEESTKNLILYGGSVAPINASDLASNGAIDGFLVGRQSLEPASFGEIIKIVSLA